MSQAHDPKSRGDSIREKHQSLLAELGRRLTSLTGVSEAPDRRGVIAHLAQAQQQSIELFDGNLAMSLLLRRLQALEKIEAFSQVDLHGLEDAERRAEGIQQKLVYRQVMQHLTHADMAVFDLQPEKAQQLVDEAKRALQREPAPSLVQDWLKDLEMDINTLVSIQRSNVLDGVRVSFQKVFRYAQPLDNPDERKQIESMFREAPSSRLTSLFWHEELRLRLAKPVQPGGLREEVWFQLYAPLFDELRSLLKTDQLQSLTEKLETLRNRLKQDTLLPYLARSLCLMEVEAWTRRHAQAIELCEALAQICSVKVPDALLESSSSKAGKRSRAAQQWRVVCEATLKRLAHLLNRVEPEVFFCYAEDWRSCLKSYSSLQDQDWQTLEQLWPSFESNRKTVRSLLDRAEKKSSEGEAFFRFGHNQYEIPLQQTSPMISRPPETSLNRRYETQPLSVSELEASQAPTRPTMTLPLPASSLFVQGDTVSSAVRKIPATEASVLALPSSAEASNADVEQGVTEQQSPQDKLSRLKWLIDQINIFLGGG